MITVLLIAILTVQVVTLVVAVVGTNFDIRGWRIPIIGEAAQAVTQKLLKHGR
ncbi:hypothetical protein LCGC14_1808560 [marine sediment metagenome]|uniref:Uncharacterized protein n=1 Tax=marine sediment metagenome TaxID=412755 RepID=A0A0F9J260_9ZZZZ